MDKDILKSRVSITIKNSALFRLIENIIDQNTVERLISTITDHLMTGKYNREKSLDYISELIEDELERSDIELDDDVDGISMAILFVYEELVDGKNEFFLKIQEKHTQVTPLCDSDSEAE
ncbi:hypothetical protein CWI42_121370 [Ordospora colligata]|uniref:Uncharacterized protein n=1 Tax=Ordospora colligata OC4 TaxID=1354746 RepID=A0A0B2UI59_9MICR|nr:uncharacterized protein M896_121370 [Ordospora colligata OC4]KHN68914.1 hypothetical protein M896_121370 [Ordospora colligata OC4]TBU13948.1 hypothetical protein CWI40_121370 [Ordospora colligata]TBU14137.1 hypothetical protein CWI41_121370 [Ordospora colligata]TBU17806.1 hypothetical protein CWI42_121370 [Ordospora colligata]